MLVRGREGAGGDTVLDVFPAVPAAWPDVSVSGLRVEGAFAVDASRDGGRTSWVRVHSDAGGSVTIRHGIDGPIDVRSANGGALAWRPGGPREIVLRLDAGTGAVLSPGGSPRPELHPHDVAPIGTADRWGLPGSTR
jgi:alpha-L-fucosidase 2